MRLSKVIPIVDRNNGQAFLDIALRIRCRLATKSGNFREVVICVPCIVQRAGACFTDLLWWRH